MEYDFFGIQKQVTKNNAIYEEEINHEIRNLKNRIYDILTEIFQYYRIPINQRLIENFIDDLETPLKNETCYKKILIEMNDAISNALRDKTHAQQIFYESFEKQRNINRRVDFYDLINQVSHTFSKMPINDNAKEDLISELRKQIIKFEETIHEISDNYTRNNETQIRNLKQSTIYQFNNDFEREIAQRYFFSLKQVDDNSMIDFLEDGFSNLEEAQMKGFIQELIRMTPPDRINLIQFLNEKQDSIDPVKKARDEASKLIA